MAEEQVIPGITTPSPPTDNKGQLFTAAILEASTSQCRCASCKILRKLATSLKKDLVQEVKE